MSILRTLLATFLLPGLAVAQQHVSFPTQDGGVVDADLYGKSAHAVVLALEDVSTRKVGRSKCLRF
jgi:hypothetical protein